MNRFFLSAAVLALFAGAGASAAASADSAADSKYSYRPYSQQNQAGGNAESSPANATGAPPEQSYSYGRATEGDRTGAPAYNQSARSNPAPYRQPADERDGPDDNADGPPRPATGNPPPQGGFAATRLVEATASAPDRSVPYAVREQDARRAAIEAWRSKAADRFGPEFSQWRMASHRHVDCVRERGDDATCTASGIPIRGDGRMGRALGNED